MTIGNFDGYFNSDTLNLHKGGSPPSYWEVAYCLIDDVSVLKDTSWHVGVNEQLDVKNEALEVYPNPNTGTFTVDLTGG